MSAEQHTELFHSAFGDFRLARRPPTPNQPLQAWDATDEYLLAQISELDRANGGAEFGPVLLINDQFGALAIALHALQPYSWGDSCTAHLALAENFASNQLPNTANLIPATQPPYANPVAQKYRVVLWRIPKSIALFEQQALLLADVVDTNTLILAGGMIKHLPEQSVDILRRLGRVDILHAQKKARLFKVSPSVERISAPPPPVVKPQRIDDLDLILDADANVFAREKFDIGARFFIEQFKQLPRAQRIADLGCGNGVLGIVAKRLQPAAQVFFFDESYQAVESATRNYSINLRDSIENDATHAIDGEFYFDDCLSHYDGAPFDLILCNPPFHQNHATGDQIAWRMFTQSKQHLRDGGELWIVGNRHLEYPAKLKRIFGNCQQVAAHPKFVVLVARK